MKTKVCTQCHGQFPLTSFYSSKRGLYNRRGSCKKCCSINSKMNRDSKREIAGKRLRIYNQQKEPTEELVWKRRIQVARERIKYSHIPALEQKRTAFDIDAKYGLASYRIGEVK